VRCAASSTHGVCAVAVVARALTVRGHYGAAAAQLQAMRGAAALLPSPSFAGRFESDVLREEAHVLQCTGQLRRATKALKTSISLLRSAAPAGSRAAPRPADFFDRYQRMATLQLWQGRPRKARRAIELAIAAQGNGGGAGAEVEGAGAAAAAVLWRHRGAEARPMASFVAAASTAADRPWRELGDNGGGAQEAESGWAQTAAVLRRHYSALRDEAIALWRGGGGGGGGGGGLFSRQPECLHTALPGFNTTREPPHWWQLPVVGVDFVAHQSGGCNRTRTPAGCALVRALAQRRRQPGAAGAAGGGAASNINSSAGAGWWGVERVGYSALERGGWIRPHWGETNSRLKMHLALVTPTHTVVAPPAHPHEGKDHGADAAAGAGGGDGRRRHCRAWMRVGGSAAAAPAAAAAAASTRASARDGGSGGHGMAERRVWERGKVLFFDDSYEHEVAYNCSGAELGAPCHSR
jgi:hypothetical protein